MPHGALNLALSNKDHNSETNRLTLARFLALIGVAILVLATNIAFSILYMVVYGHVISPGHPPEYYQDHIQIAAPYCSIIAGVPIMYFTGWWIAGCWRRELGYHGAIVVWVAYTLIDLSVLLVAGLTFWIGVLFATSFLTKLAAVWRGAALRLNSRMARDVALIARESHASEP